MKKNLVKFSIFAIIFILLLTLLSIIYIDKTDIRKFQQFYNEPKNTLDILIFGPSPTRYAVLPPVLWEEAGITSYNFCMGSSPAAAQYYWLKEALNYQSPSVVIIWGGYLFRDENLFDASEPRFRQALDPMRLSRNKIASIIDVVSNSEDQQVISYLFPLFRYHARQYLYPEDFDFSIMKKRNTRMGYVEYDKFIDIKPQERPEEFDDYNHSPNFQCSEIWLTKMIDLCKANDIDVIITAIPMNNKNAWSIYRHNALQEYTDKQGVVIIDFYYGEPKDASSLDHSIDYSEPSHVNIGGATKISDYIAKYLSDNYNLPDRRKDEYDPHWNAVMDTYYELYNEYLIKLK